MRAGLKEMFAWPTYPQVYAAGKLVGGLDVLAELAGEGELLAALGLPAAGGGGEGGCCGGEAKRAQAGSGGCCGGTGACGGGGGGGGGHAH